MKFQKPRVMLRHENRTHRLVSSTSIISSDVEIAVAKSSRLLIDPISSEHAAGLHGDDDTQYGIFDSSEVCSTQHSYSSRIREKDGVCSDCKLYPAAYNCRKARNPSRTSTMSSSRSCETGTKVRRCVRKGRVRREAEKLEKHIASLCGVDGIKANSNFALLVPV
jgi:hypothetical protein